MSRIVIVVDIFFLFKFLCTLADDVFEVPTKGHLLLSLVCLEDSVLVRPNNMKESKLRG